MIYDLFKLRSDANIHTTLLSLFTILILVIVKQFLDPFVKKFTKIPLPYDLTVVRISWVFVVF